MQYPLNPDVEILKWGPTPLYPLLRWETCVTGILVLFSKLYPGYFWPKSLIISDQSRSVWMCEHSAIRKNGAKLFLEVMLPKAKREAVRTKWKESLAELNKLENQIGGDASSLADNQLTEMWKEFHRLTDNFWAHASLPELSNYGSSELLEEKLRDYVPPEEIASVMEILCAPAGMSFYQEEEIDLAETADVMDHQKKYFWLKNSYANVEILPVEFFEKRQQEVASDIREVVTARLKRAQESKDAVQEKYKLPLEIREIGDAIADGIQWQDTRKKDIWIYLHYEDVLLREIAKRMSADKHLLTFATHEEIPDIFSGAISTDILQPRLNGTGIYVDEKGTVQMISPEDAKKYWSVYVDTKQEKNISEFKGIVASKGNGPVRGRVKIVLDPHGEVDFTEGDVLVATMTTPEFIFVMKKAVAIITDAGGLTSHAAIVSRELGVPCLVGTKIATRVLHDGDLVEVDASDGTVKIIR
jgi:phosphoenolpyruvate synthase/pyruvate phosphate dikinase